MSVEAIAIALHHSRARNSTTLAVLVGIANHDGDGGAWPTIKTLAHYARVKDRTVQNSLVELVRLGEIDRDIQGGGTAEVAHYDRPNLYHFKLKCPDHCDGSRAHKLICQGCKKPLPKSSQLVQFHPKCDPQRSVIHPVQSDAPGASECTGGVHDSAPKTNIETSLNYLTRNVDPGARELNRARGQKRDASGADLLAAAAAAESAQGPENDASGDSRQPAIAAAAFDLTASLAAATALPVGDDFETCPRRRGYMPHTYSPANGECIDCGAPAPHRINYETGEVA